MSWKQQWEVQVELEDMDPGDELCERDGQPMTCGSSKCGKREGGLRQAVFIVVCKHTVSSLGCKRVLERGKMS